MRSEKINKKYKNIRAVFWGNTNALFQFKPSRSFEQRVTFSSYYNANCCGTGGVLFVFVVGRLVRSGRPVGWRDQRY